MNNVYVVVEGQTEQTFIREILSPYLSKRNIYMHAALIGTPGHKGENIRSYRARQDIRNFLSQRSDTYITTMLDYFRIDPGWPGYGEIESEKRKGRSLSAMEKAAIINDRTSGAIQSEFAEYRAGERFVPYFEMHEFESLLFSDARILAKAIGVSEESIKDIISQHESPEEINDDPQNAPSKRIEKFYPQYRKVAMGVSIADKIGISAMRDKCVNFDRWLSCLESL